MPMGSGPGGPAAPGSRSSLVLAGGVDLATEVRGQQLVAAEQVTRAAVENDLALGQHVGPVGVLQGHVHELLDDEYGRAGGVDVADDVEELVDDLGRQAQRQLIDD